MHMTGASMVALFENGTDTDKRIVGSPGMRPVLPNTSTEEVEEFRRRITPVDLIGCVDVAAIHAEVEALASAVTDAAPAAFQYQPAAVERVRAEGIDPKRIKLDKAGYFVVNLVDGGLLVEHYDYKENLLRIIEGDSARSIYLTLVRNGWVSKLDHAAYLGKELARAELCRKHGLEYIQDGG